MIGLGGGQVVGPVTIDTLDAKGFEPSDGSRFVTSRTVTDLMCAGQRKTAFLVQFADIFNDP